MTEDENIRNGQQISKHLFLILFIGLIPFIAIFILLTLNPYMKIFIAIADLTRNWPGMTSAHNPLMSKIMDVYLKSFPAFCLFYAFITFKYTIPKDNPHILKSIFAALLMIALVALLVYYISYCNHELTREFRFHRIISYSDFFMTLFFMLAFSAFYFIDSFSLTGIIGNSRVIIKGRG
jgi:hypothetical protein